MSALLIWISPQYLLHIKLTAAQEQETAGDEDQGKTEPIKATQAKQVVTENQTQREQEKARHVSRRTGGRDNAASKRHVQISSSADAETNPTDGFSGILLVVSMPRLLSSCILNLHKSRSLGWRYDDPDFQPRLKGQLIRCVRKKWNSLIEKPPLFVSTLTASDGTFELSNKYSKNVLAWVRTSNLTQGCLASFST
jgi:hypothetical protein